ncbi:hypothetical protein Ciccas_006673 [Cichlidogyrus casuarinus]|uniref:Uncharacterized protein n=1 Tax=Cichlidogyrus casuarinus TaxID=1844966 RepID=A0ABD2Q537_9PLAT
MLPTSLMNKIPLDSLQFSADPKSFLQRPNHSVPVTFEAHLESLTNGTVEDSSKRKAESELMDTSSVGLLSDDNSPKNLSVDESSLKSGFLDSLRFSSLQNNMTDVKFLSNELNSFSGRNSPPSNLSRMVRQKVRCCVLKRKRSREGLSNTLTTKANSVESENQMRGIFSMASNGNSLLASSSLDRVTSHDSTSFHNPNLTDGQLLLNQLIATTSSFMQKQESGQNAGASQKSTAGAFRLGKGSDLRKTMSEPSLKIKSTGNPAQKHKASREKKHFSSSTAMAAAMAMSSAADDLLTQTTNLLKPQLKEGLSEDSSNKKDLLNSLIDSISSNGSLGSAILTALINTDPIMAHKIIQSLSDSPPQPEDCTSLPDLKAPSTLFNAGKSTPPNHGSPISSQARSLHFKSVFQLALTLIIHA